MKYYIYVLPKSRHYELIILLKKILNNNISFIEEIIDNDNIQFIIKKYNILNNDKFIIFNHWGLKSMYDIIDCNYEKCIKNISWDNKEGDNLLSFNIFTKFNYLYILYSSWEISKLDIKNIQHKKIFTNFINNYLYIDQNKIKIIIPEVLNDYNNKIIPLYSFDLVYIREIYNNQNSNLIIPINEKKKRFIYLNANSNTERFILFSYIKIYFQQYFYYSFLGKYNIDLDKCFEYLSKYNINLKQINYIYNEIPFKLDDLKLFDFKNDNSWYKLSDKLSKFISESYIFILNESVNSNNNYQQISEKTYKPIKLCMPFIIFSTYGNLYKHLHKLNFKTFSPYICEDFDNAQLSFNERIYLFFKEIRRLCEMEINDFKKIYKKLFDISVYNYNLFNSKKIGNKYIQEFKNIII